MKQRIYVDTSVWGGVFDKGFMHETLKEKVDITPDALTLAQTYVFENVVGSTSFDDCLHIATAAVNRADMLVSWNFKHIVNVFRVRGYNAINMKLGYPTLNIHSPKEIVGYENENYL